MSKALQEKIKELFEATKNLQSFEEIKPYCDRFNAWVSESNYSQKSLGTLLIAATGRRPHEILARAKFKQVQGKPYKVSFSGHFISRIGLGISTLPQAITCGRVLANFAKREIHKEAASN